MWKLFFPFLAALLALGFGRHRDGGMDANANDPDVQKALQVAMDEYNRNSPDNHLFKVVTVLRVQKKMVEGYMYTLTVIIAKTSCRKGRRHGRCHILLNPQRAEFHRCKFVVLNGGFVPQWTLLEQRCF
ncbi:cystatin [Oryzias melastigma]|uniref:Cystatin-like n=1 Tax=Oryzias melastigma TaxID=30732 RepID=A0A3B3CPJ5_ORYME|nr:cystatin [Oryzias melastigma]